MYSGQLTKFLDLHIPGTSNRIRLVKFIPLSRHRQYLVIVFFLSRYVPITYVYYVGITQYYGLSRDGAAQRIGKIKIKRDRIAPFESLYCSIMERYLRTTLRSPDLHNIFRSTPERWHFIFESITQYNMHMRAFTMCSFYFLHTQQIYNVVFPNYIYQSNCIRNVIG